MTSKISQPEQLTGEERIAMTRGYGRGPEKKALRIIDALEAECERLRTELAGYRGCDTATYDRLAAANALLESLKFEPGVPENQKARIAAHLAGAARGVKP